MYDQECRHVRHLSHANRDGQESDETSRFPCEEFLYELGSATTWAPSQPRALRLTRFCIPYPTNYVCTLDFHAPMPPMPPCSLGEVAGLAVAHLTGLEKCWKCHYRSLMSLFQNVVYLACSAGVRAILLAIGSVQENAARAVPTALLPFSLGFVGEYNDTQPYI